MPTPSDKNMTALFTIIKAGSYVFRSSDNNFFSARNPINYKSLTEKFLDHVSLVYLKVVHCEST